MVSTKSEASVTDETLDIRREMLSATNGDKVNAKNPFDGVNAFIFKGGAGKTTAKLSQAVRTPLVVDGDTVTISAQIDSGSSASGKLQVKLGTDMDRQIKARVKFDQSGAYAPHDLVRPISLQAGVVDHWDHSDADRQIAKRQGVCGCSQPDGGRAICAAWPGYCRRPH